MDIVLAFSAGLLSFLSPCVLQLIPAYLSYIAGATVSEINTNKAKWNLMIRSAFFIIGFSMVFILLGLVKKITETVNIDDLKTIKYFVSWYICSQRLSFLHKIPNEAHDLLLDLVILYFLNNA